jgi:midasin (ATPase involved in ribosome maturation)
MQKGHWVLLDVPPSVAASPEGLNACLTARPSIFQNYLKVLLNIRNFRVFAAQNPQAQGEVAVKGLPEVS